MKKTRKEDDKKDDKNDAWTTCSESTLNEICGYKNDSSIAEMNCKTNAVNFENCGMKK